MTRTAEKIDALLREDGSFEDALEAIRERADENGGEVEWGDVRDDLTSGQWGRLIEKGILVDGEAGFEIADRGRYDDALDGDGDVGGDYDVDVEIDEEASKWSQWDKMAAVLSVSLMIGYWFESVRDTIGGTVDLLLAPLDATLPFYAVILSVAMLTGLYSTLLQANLMNMDRMAKYQKRMKAMQNKQKDARERKKEAEERGASEEELDRLEQEVKEVQQEQMEAMADNLGMFKEQFRPMVWIMLFTIPFFLWMWWKIHDTGIDGTNATMVMPMIGVVDWETYLRDIRLFRPWIIWYFLCSMGFTQLLRKAINIDMTPSTD